MEIREFPMVRKTDRDLELPLFAEFLEKNADKISSVLDIGAHYSADYYASNLRKYVQNYVALDPNFDKAVAAIADEFIISGFFEANPAPADLVLCLSTLEHFGMYPIKYEDYRFKQECAFTKMVGLAKKFLWISFPVAKTSLIPGEMSPIDEEQLEDFEMLVAGNKVQTSFYWSDGPQAGFPWHTSTRAQCFAYDYANELGNRAICVMEIEP